MSCPAESTLLLYAEKLDDSCRSHVDACDACRATVDELERTIGELRSAAPVATNHAMERLMQVRPSSGPRRLFFAAAAVILIVTGAGLYRLGVGSPPKHPPQRPVQPAQPVPVPAPKDESAEMIAKALTWLSRNQKPNGSFGGAGVTALALQAFFGAGHGENSPEYGRTVRAAVAFLLGSQADNGQFLSPPDPKVIYDAAIASWAIIEAVAGNHCADPRVRQSAEKAVAFLVSAQNPGKGWRYSPKCGDNDTSVTFWAGCALAAARRAGFKVPDAAFDGMRAWIREATDPTTLAVGYNAPGTGKVYIPGVNEQYHFHPTMSAAAMACRLLAGDAKDAAMVPAIGLLVTDPPSAQAVVHLDYYYWHIGTMAVFLYEGSDSALYKDWHARLLKAMGTARQADGSWSSNDRWSKEGGEVYATAINALTLQTARRFAKK